MAGEHDNGAATVGWVSAIRCLEAISCVVEWPVGCRDKVERGGGHSQWQHGLFTLCRRVGSSVMNAPSCSSNYRPKWPRHPCVCCVSE